jgi:hypothetical protein
MTILLLLLSAPLIIMAVLWDCARSKRHPKTATASEWRAGMARLDSQMPLPAPSFRSRYCAKGAPGVSYPGPKNAKCNVALIKKTGTK